MKVSHDEFLEGLFAEPWLYERVKGRLVVMSPSGQERVDASERFRDQFVAYKLAHPKRIANVVSEAWIVIDEETERIADLAVYLTSTRAKGSIPQLIPDLIVEIASEGYTSLRRDYEEKRRDYQQVQVKEYLIVDRLERRVTIYRRSRGRYVELILGPNDVYSTPLLPGLAITLQGII